MFVTFQTIVRTKRAVATAGDSTHGGAGGWSAGGASRMAAFPEARGELAQADTTVEERAR